MFYRPQYYEVYLLIILAALGWFICCVHFLLFMHGVELEKDRASRRMEVTSMENDWIWLRIKSTAIVETLGVVQTISRKCNK